MMWPSSALRYSRVFYLRFDLRKHPLCQLFHIVVFKKLCHQAVKWHLPWFSYHHSYPLYLDHRLHPQGLILIADFTGFFHLTHNIMIIFADCTSFSWLSINALTCGVTQSTQPLIIQAPQSFFKLLPVLSCIPMVLNRPRFLSVLLFLVFLRCLSISPVHTQHY